MVVFTKQFEVISKINLWRKNENFINFILSFFVFSDDHDEMYTEAYGDYLYCSAKEGLSDSKAEKMFEKWAEAYQEKANSLDDNVSSVMLWPFLYKRRNERW